MRIFIGIMVTVLLCGAGTAHAFEIQYGQVKGYNNGKVLIRYQGIESTKFFVCSIKTRTCTPTKSTTMYMPSQARTTGNFYLDEKGDTTALYRYGGKNTTATPSDTKLNTTAFSIAQFIAFEAETIYYVGNTKENPEEEISPLLLDYLNNIY